MKLTKEQILGASDEQLNNLCATQILGWHKGKLMPRWEAADWFNQDGTFQCMYGSYTPTTNVSQAIELLEHMDKTKGLDHWSISRLPGFYNCIITYPNPLNSKEVYELNHADKQMCKAIVIASLFAIVAMEEA